MKDNIRLALDMLDTIILKDQNSELPAVKKARDLLVLGIKQLPCICVICGRYGCMNEHGYGGPGRRLKLGGD